MKSIAGLGNEFQWVRVFKDILMACLDIPHKRLREKDNKLLIISLHFSIRWNLFARRVVGEWLVRECLLCWFYTKGHRRELLMRD